MLTTSVVLALDPWFLLNSAKTTGIHKHRTQTPRTALVALGRLPACLRLIDASVRRTFKEHDKRQTSAPQQRCPRRAHVAHTLPRVSLGCLQVARRMTVYCANTRVAGAVPPKAPTHRRQPTAQTSWCSALTAPVRPSILTLSRSPCNRPRRLKLSQRTLSL